LYANVTDGTVSQLYQADQAQQTLQFAAQEARVASIHAAATQAAFEQVTAAAGGTADTAAQTPAKAAARKTAGRYALADFVIERT
jgi:protein kinase A